MTAREEVINMENISVNVTRAEDSGAYVVSALGADLTSSTVGTFHTLDEALVAVKGAFGSFGLFVPRPPVSA